MDLYNTYATSKLFPFERCICIMEYDIVFKDEIIVFQGLTICFNDFILDNFLLENEKEIKELFDDKNLLLIQNMRIIECETHKDFLILLKQKIDFWISFRK